ncbi:hypothetical protein PUN28_002039 [Cardiocondyla obscurior]|uniref:Uncharacterized protein n=1 Tax=Cardiocondyla obscurior TaxID=286306 RepID=A0AAW2GSH3_9HYME
MKMLSKICRRPKIAVASSRVRRTNTASIVKYRLTHCCPLYRVTSAAIRPHGLILINEVSAPLSIVSNHLLPRRFHPLTVPFYVCAMTRSSKERNSTSDILSKREKSFVTHNQKTGRSDLIYNIKRNIFGRN